METLLYLINFINLSGKFNSASTCYNIIRADYADNWNTLSQMSDLKCINN